MSTFNVKLTIGLVLVVLLLLTGASPSFWSDDSDKITACSKDANALAFGESIENSNDERMIASYTLAFVASSSNSSRIATPSSAERSSPKENSKIYKLNLAFLI
jgi:hypothetical protein